MKLLAGVLGLFVAATSIGCSHPSRAKTPAELFASMSLELSHSLVQGLTEGASADRVGTTTLTGATIPNTDPADPLPPTQLPEERFPLSALDSALDAPVRSTWGTSSETRAQARPSVASEEIPSSRDGE